MRTAKRTRRAAHPEVVREDSAEGEERPSGAADREEPRPRVQVGKVAPDRRAAGECKRPGEREDRECVRRRAKLHLERAAHALRCKLVAAIDGEGEAQDEVSLLPLACLVRRHARQQHARLSLAEARRRAAAEHGQTASAGRRRSTVLACGRSCRYPKWQV
eukprot:1322026-Prymnesium_polylepis.1